MFFVENLQKLAAFVSTLICKLLYTILHYKRTVPNSDTVDCAALMLYFCKHFQNK